MKKTLYIVLMAAGLTAYAGEMLLPQERLALPQVEGSHLICVWDELAGDWYSDFIPYDHGGTVSFQVPSTGRWYWVGLWDEQAEEYVFGKWIGHFTSQ